MKVGADAPAAWWRPSLDLQAVLDTVASAAADPVGIVAPTADLLSPALTRFPVATVVIVTEAAARRAAVPALLAFSGAHPTFVAADDRLVGSLGTLLWFIRDGRWTGDDGRRAAVWLADGGMLAIVLAGWHLTRPWHLLRLRRALRRAGWCCEWPIGYFGLRALLWALRARLTAAHRIDRRDDHSAALRVRLREPWPVAGTGRHVLVLARRRC